MMEHIFINGTCMGCGGVITYVVGHLIGGAPSLTPVHMRAIQYGAGHLCDDCADTARECLARRRLHMEEKP
jgi:hypothetical protein